MAFYFVNRLDVDQVLFDTLEAVGAAPSYNGYLRVYWEDRKHRELSSTHRQEDLRLLQYAFERGDHFLAYDMRHLKPGETAGFGDAVDRSMRRMSSIGIEVKLELPAYGSGSIHVGILRFKHQDDAESFRETKEFKNMR